MEVVTSTRSEIIAVIILFLWPTSRRFTDSNIVNTWYVADDGGTEVAITVKS